MEPPHRQRRRVPVFFFNDTATTEIYTLSLHDALPIWRRRRAAAGCRAGYARACARSRASRSEEHTSELQSQSNLVCRLLLEKKKKRIRRISSQTTLVALLAVSEAARPAQPGPRVPVVR